MIGRLSLWGFVAGTALVQVLASLPARGLVWAAGFCLALLALAALRLRRWWRALRWLLPLFALVAGFAYAAERAHARLNVRLQPADVNQVSRVDLRIDRLVASSVAGLRFEGQVLASSPPRVPSRIRVFWPVPHWRGPYASGEGVPKGLPLLQPGEVWRMALILRPPAGLLNPGGPDGEAHAFARGYRASGRVRGSPEYLRTQAWASLAVAVHRLRERLRQAMAPVLHGLSHGGVLRALAIGDQSGLRQADWDTFNRSGIVHLVSISGTHVTLVSGLFALCVSAFWRRLSWRGRRLAQGIPSQVPAALAALLAALAYSLLAGWGIPAQRSFLMLAIVALAHIFRLHLGPSRLLALAAFAVVLMDPWAVLSRGFWLSFGAIAILLMAAAAHGRGARQRNTSLSRRLLATFRASLRLQFIISAALFPALAMLFHEIPLVSPLVNLYAIPVVGLVVTPLALLAAALSLHPASLPVAQLVARLADGLLVPMMQASQWLASLPLASPSVAKPPLLLSCLAFGGLILALSPRGLPWRHAGWACLLPALLWPSSRPPEGGWDALAFDVGQGGAILLRTARHNFLFDAGLRSSAEHDSGRDVLLPALRRLGVRRLSVLVVSHADLDHVGGVRSLLSAMRPGQSHASFDLEQWLRREAARLPSAQPPESWPLAMTACHRGQQWQVDGVRFEMLWPPASRYSPLDAGSRERNGASCVLSVRGRHHALLLPGDISAREEVAILASGLAAHSVLLAAHHGSRTSSSAGFLGAVAPAHIVVQAGRWNRHGHPHPQVVARAQRLGARIWRNDWHGAVHLRSRSDGLALAAERARRRRYWHSFIAPEEDLRDDGSYVHKTSFQADKPKTP